MRSAKRGSSRGKHVFASEFLLLSCLGAPRAPLPLTAVSSRQKQKVRRDRQAGRQLGLLTIIWDFKVWAEQIQLLRRRKEETNKGRKLVITQTPGQSDNTAHPPVPRQPHSSKETQIRIRAFLSPSSSQVSPDFWHQGEERGWHQNLDEPSSVRSQHSAL